jgi:uncharacterized membrane protein YsdA (DUF1294 family)
MKESSIYMLIVNIITFFVYGIDKLRVKAIITLYKN